MAFKMRTTRPEAGNKYYITKANGGYSYAIKGSPTDKQNDVLSNCVGYAYGRFNEIGGYGYCKYLSPVNAERFPQYNNTGIPMGQTPKLGACMVWRGGPTLNSGDGVGHVAIVEKIYSPTKIMTSESGWGSKNPFWNATREKGNGNWGAGAGYKFLGFIYNPAVTDTGDVDTDTSNQYGFGKTNSPLVNYTKISPNKTSPRNHVIDTVTIHCVVGQCSVEALGNIFAPTSKQASSNYGIGPDGRIGMYVEEKDRSWCSSNGANDNRAITIEVASDTTSPYKVTDAAFNSLIKLLADICKRNNIKSLKWKADKNLIGHPEEQNMTVHRWFANKSCPGDYLYNKHYEIAEKVNELLGVQEEDEDMTQERFNELMTNYLTELAEKDPSAWSADARTWAESNGYIKGDEKGRKMYKKFMTREEMIQVLYRIMNDK